MKKKFIVLSIVLELCIISVWLYNQPEQAILNETSGINYQKKTVKGDNYTKILIKKKYDDYQIQRLYEALQDEENNTENPYQQIMMASNNEAKNSPW